MSLQRMIKTAVVTRATPTSDGYGGVKAGALTTIAAAWKCILSVDFSAYYKQDRGKGGRKRFRITGEKTTIDIKAGDLVAVIGLKLEVVEAERQEDPYGTLHHWRVLAEEVI